MAEIIPREEDTHRLRSALRRAPVVLVTGPRQAGKSTLARVVVQPPRSNIFDLEDPRDAARLGEPTLSLPALAGTVVIDEAQRRQDLFPVLRVLVDEDDRPGRFLVLGSASPDLVGLASESLAGRVTLVELGGFRLADVGADMIETLWERGGLPRSYLAQDAALSQAWRDDYISTFLERDLANLGVRIPATTMRRFWTMIAHFHGQTWNGAELARAMAVSQATVRRYLDSLTDALVVRQLHAGAELDLIVDLNGERVGVEVKRTDQPRVTPSIRHALSDLGIDRVIIIHAGAQRFPVAPRVEAIPAQQVLTEGLAAGR